jgi:hypothetical protein
VVRSESQQSELGIVNESFRPIRSMRRPLRPFRNFRIKSGKFRNYCISDEIVYVAQSTQGNPEIGIPFAKLYLANRIWLALQFRFFVQRNTYLNCVFGVQDCGDGTSGRIDLGSDTAKRNAAMLVDIAERAQLPQSMLLRRTRSVVWLECIDFRSDIAGEKAKRLLKLPSFFTVCDSRNHGEIDSLGTVLPCFRGGQLPSKLVQTRTQAIEKFPKKHRGYIRNILGISPTDIKALLTVLPWTMV